MASVLRPRWLVLVLLLIFAGIHLQYVCKLTHSQSSNRSAFLRWRPQLLQLNEGVNVWEKYAYPNPPIMALILSPYVQLSPLCGSTLWFATKALLAILAIFLVLSLLDSPEQPFPLWGKLLAIGLSLRPIEGDLVHGNVNLFLLFLVMASIYAFSQKRQYTAGLLLALSIACKLTPALFLAYYLWRRAWQTLLAAAVGLVLFVLAIPASVFGWSNNLDYLASWHQQMIAPYAAGMVTSEHKNQSLPGLLYRMLSEEPSFSDYVGTQKIVQQTHNLVCWEHTTVQLIIVGCMIAFVGLSMRYCLAGPTSRPNWQLLAECSVVILGMLLFCERTWKHHCVTLLLPFSVAAYGLAVPTLGRALRCYLAITLVASVALMLATSSGHVDADVPAQERWGKWAQVYGAYVWVFLLLLASMCVLLASVRKNLPLPFCQLRLP